MNWLWAVRDVLRHPVRSLLALVGIAVASALLLDMVLLSGGIERSFEKLLLSRGYQVRVSPKGTLPFDTEASFGDATTTLARIRATSGVVQAGPILGASLFARLPAGLTPLVAYGIDPTAQGIYVVEEGGDLAPNDSSHVLLGAPAAKRLHAGLGDTITLVGRLDPQIAAPAQSRLLVVRGIVHFLYDARDQPSIALSWSVVQSIQGHRATDRASVMLVRVADGADTGTVVRQLRHDFPALGINTVGDLVAKFRERLAYFRQLSLILGSIALVVTVLLVSTLLAITVNERLGEIATLRAIGVSRMAIVRQVVVQGMALVLPGGVLGIALGLITARWLDAILTSFPGLPAAISFFVAEPRQLAVAAVTLLLTGLGAGLLPAWQAANAPIAATLRSDAT
ncbi:MAG: FtsX-like permease family protein [Gemmatimonadota bacterium]